MTEQKNVTEDDLRQMRVEVDRLFAESLAKMREAQAANRELYAATLLVRAVAARAKRDDDEEGK